MPILINFAATTNSSQRHHRLGTPSTLEIFFIKTTIFIWISSSANIKKHILQKHFSLLNSIKKSKTVFTRLNFFKRSQFSGTFLILKNLFYIQREHHRVKVRRRLWQFRFSRLCKDSADLSRRTSPPRLLRPYHVNDRRCR